jgi:hypothetical protein
VTLRRWSLLAASALVAACGIDVAGGIDVGSGGSSTGGGTGGAAIHDPAWWDPAHKTRYPITITNPSGPNTPKDLQVVLSVDTQALDKATTPYAGWRIVSWDGSKWTEQTRVIDDAAGRQWIWFRLSAPLNTGQTDTSHWLYTDDPSAQAPPYASDVWEYVKIFDTQDPANWFAQNATNQTWDGSSVLLDGNGAGSSLRSKNTYGPNVGLDFAMTVVSPLASAAQWFCGGFQRTNDFIDQSPWILWISRSPAAIVPEFYDGGGGNHVGTGLPIDFTAEHIYGIDRFARLDVFRYDNSASEQISWSTDYNTQHQIRFTAYNGSKIKLRWVRVRKALNPPPTLTLGPAEAY